MTKNQIIEQLFRGKNFNDAIFKMEPAHLRDDLKMEVITIVCEWPEEKILKLHSDNALDFYVVRVILNQAKSSTSPFAKKYRAPFLELKDVADHSESIEDRQVREQMEDFALEEIERLYWYDAEMIRLYLKLGSFRAIEEHTGIPFISCYKNIKKSMATLKKRALEEKPRTIFTKKEIEFIKNNKP
jgi:hypothetical protein